MKNNKGFTLVELMIELMIIGILATIVIPHFQSSKDDVKVEQESMSVVGGAFIPNTLEDKEPEVSFK